MKKTILAVLAVTAIIFAMTITASAMVENPVIIDESNRILITDELLEAGGGDQLILAAQYDADMKLISLDYSYLLSFKPDINKESALLKVFVWDSMNKMDNIAVPVLKKLDFTERLSINFCDIADMTVSSSEAKIKYYTNKEKSRTDTVSINPNAKYTINGKSDVNYNNLFLAKCVYSGYISENCCDYAQIDFYRSEQCDTFDYDSVDITLYETFAAVTYNESTMEITADDASPSFLLSISTSGEDYDLSIKDIYGNDVMPNNIKRNNILSLCITPYDWRLSSDIESITAILSDNIVTGYVTDISPETVYINEVPYTISDTASIELDIDCSGNFMFDINGKLILYARNTDNYGIVLKTNIHQGIDILCQVKMYTSDGKIEIRNLAPKVKLRIYDSGSYRETTLDDRNVINLFSEFPAVCTYTLNSYGEIRRLSISDGNTYGYLGISPLTANTLNRPAEITNKFIATDNLYRIDKDTRIIAVKSTAEADISKPDNYALYSCNDIKTAGEYDCVSVYNVNRNNYAGLIVIYGADLAQPEPVFPADDKPFAMVKQVKSSVNSEGDEFNILVTADNGNYTLEYGKSNSLNEGEILVIDKITNDEVNGCVLENYIKAVEKSENGAYVLTNEFIEYYKNLCEADSDVTYYFGKVDYKFKNTIYFTDLLNYKNGSFVPKTDESIFLPESISVSVYDQSSPQAVTWDSPSYMAFSAKPDAYGNYPIAYPEIKSYYILVRELQGKIQQIAYFCYTTDVEQQIIN